MTIHICRACGTSYPEAATPPAACAICDDGRQYVPAGGQAWTTPAALAAGHRNAWAAHEPGLISLQTVPAFAINQRAFLLSTPSGNVLWDCVALLDPATEALVRGLGGLKAIAVSHPHYYTTVQDWAAAFDAPVRLHAADRRWIVRPDPAIRLWEGDDLDVLSGVTLVRLGGHFPGGTVLHWADGAAGAGVLLVGDILQVTPGAHGVSFLWSYPNMLPLAPATVRRLAARLAPWKYRRIYGAFAGQDVADEGPTIVARSVARYCALIERPGSDQD